MESFNSSGEDHEGSKSFS
jgi:hypothetical protein